MKIAIVGSRNLTVTDLQRYLPKGVTEIVSGSARGIDTCARKYAYEKYGRSAPLKRNLQIIDYADAVIAFWDGKSRGTKYVIDACKNKRIKITIYKKCYFKEW